MRKLSSSPTAVNSSRPTSLPLHTRRQINARATCPWCGSQMYLNRTGTRLQCSDSVHCAGVLRVKAAQETQE